MRTQNRRWLGAAAVTLLVACGGTSVAVLPPPDGGVDGRGPTDGTLSGGDASGDENNGNDGEAPDSGESADAEPDTGDLDSAIDSGTADTGPADTGATDTGVSDSGQGADSQPADTGLVDSGPPPMDSSLPDTERVDTGSEDSEPPPMDSTAPFDSARFDTGRPDDTGVRDTGVVDAPSCPSTVPTGACTSIGAMCSYPGDVCYCNYGAPIMATPSWHCFTLPPNCPQPEPAVGSACTMNGETCNYGACQGGNELVCTGGTWAVQGVLCPP